MNHNIKQGEIVTAKKWNGDIFQGIYIKQYQDKSHLVKENNTNREFNVKPNDIITTQYQQQLQIALE